MKLQTLLSRTDEIGDCLIWTSTIGATGYPVINTGGQVHHARRLMHTLSGGIIGAGQVVRATCEDKRCINPAHLYTTTRKKVAQSSGKKGLMGGPIRAAATSARHRKNSKLTEAAAVEIRASSESGKALAQRFGITTQHANNIKRGTAWRDYSSPFLGLMRGAA